jgi:hypothetical protein
VQEKNLRTIEQVRKVLCYELKRYNENQVHSVTGEIPAMRLRRPIKEGKPLFRPFKGPWPYKSTKDIFCLRQERTTNAYRKISLDGMDMPRRSPYRIDLTDNERVQLERIAQKYTAPYYSVMRAKIVLLAAQGVPNDEVAGKLNMPRQIVSKWRKRFYEQRISGLEDQARAGRPARFPPQGRGGSKSPGL